MDITLNRKKKKKEPAHTSEKQSQGNPIIDLKDDEFTVDGQVFKMAPDLKDLPEFDWDAPENQEWIKQEDDRMRKKLGHLTHEDGFKLIDLRLKIQKQNPTLSLKEAAELALAQFQKKEGRGST